MLQVKNSKDVHGQLQVRQSALVACNNGFGTASGCRTPNFTFWCIAIDLAVAGHWFGDMPLCPCLPAFCLVVGRSIAVRCTQPFSPFNILDLMI